MRAHAGGACDGVRCAKPSVFVCRPLSRPLNSHPVERTALRHHHVVVVACVDQGVLDSLEDFANSEALLHELP